MEERIRVLSIDFDYFLDTDLATREHCFPAGADRMEAALLESLWQLVYREFPWIGEMGVIPSFEEICERVRGILEKNPGVQRRQALSHKEIGGMFSQGKTYLIHHIDFHHDYYIGQNPHRLDCSNWLRLVMEAHPESQVIWYCRENSVRSSIAGEFPHATRRDLQGLLEMYDCIFLCFSPEWSPPHLQGTYHRLAALLE